MHIHLRMKNKSVFNRVVLVYKYSQDTCTHLLHYFKLLYLVQYTNLDNAGTGIPVVNIIQ